MALMKSMRLPGESLIGFPIFGFYAKGGIGTLGGEDLRGESGGIPHLAKNERDMGHPGFALGKGCQALMGFAPSLSTHVRWCERGAPRQSCVRGRMDD
jgi:hypothetical protein